MNKITHKNNIFLFSFIIFAIVLIPFISQINTTHADEFSEQSLYYYWGDGCSHCAEVSPIIDSLNQKYPDLNIIKKEIWHNKENATDFSKMAEKLKVPDNERGVPFIIMGNSYFVGDKPIIDNLDALIAQNLKSIDDQSDNGQNNTKILSTNLSLLAITGAALADSINPCAIAVLIILLSALMLSNNKKRALKSGISFIVGVYITYFFLGIGLLYVLKISPVISNWIYPIVGVLAILIGLSNIKDYFWYGGGGFVTEIPRKWRPTMQKIIKSTTSPISAFFIGIVITFFELPCTGGPYFFTIGLLSKNISWNTIVPLLIYYNIIFILPLLAILVLIYFGYTNVKKASKIRQKNIHILHLITGIIMLALGVWVLLV